MRRGAKPAKAKVEAKLPVGRKSRMSQGSKVRDLEKRLAESFEREKATGEVLQETNRALTEALEQQTATSEILRVIASSPTNAQPVFDAIARRSEERREVKPLSDEQMALVRHVAEQAVMDIGKVRLFEELQEKDEALKQAHAQVTEALEQQTATSEILRVIASSPTNVQPVFDAIASSAFALCAAKFVAVFRLENGILDIVAMHSTSP